MKIALTVGHSEKVRGMRGSPVPPECDEVDECYKICTDVSKLLESQGVQCPMFFDTTSTSQSQYLNNINAWVNNNHPDADLAVSCHLNAAGSDGPVGCEVWYYTQKTMAAKIASAMADALDLPDRGPKYSNSLSFLVNTTPPAVLLECFFGDSRTDCEHYHQAYAALVEAIAESMAGIEIDDTPVEPEPPEPEPVPPSGDNRVIIDSMISGDVTIVVNGKMIVGHEGCEHVVDLQIRGEGDVVLQVNGELFYGPEAEQPGEPDEQPGVQDNHSDVVTTVFGGSDDPNYSAYPPYDSDGNGRLLDGDTELFVALPMRIEGNRPRVRVYHGELSAEGTVEDVGPWCTSDSAYCLGHDRPLAETAFNTGTPLPAGSGPHAGKIPSNAAGLDISPALANKIGIEGKGVTDWEFVDE